MALSRRKIKVGFFPGVFDFVHAGHVIAFEEAKQHCDYLIVGLQTDPSIDRKWKKKPIMSLEERWRMLRGNRWVDAILVYETEREREVLKSWLPYDIYFVGQDHVKSKYFKLSRNHEYSSTNIREKVKSSG